VKSVNKQISYAAEESCVPLLVFPTRPLSACKYEQNVASAPKYGMYVILPH
jgi:hypothetical protein